MDNKQRPLNASKQYKNAILKHSRKLNFKTDQEITKLSRHEPRAFWKLLKEKQSDRRLPPLETLYEYLKDVNSSQDTTPQPYFNTDSDSNSILNIPISQEEILSVVKSLKNNKASGPDKILNEYIKQTIDCMINVYVKVFNLIFEKGVFPDSWLIGIIKPIYKTGDKNNTENYRPITLLSCLGKLFTAVLNNRLKLYLESYDVLSEAQAGFRKEYSTSDHMFTLYGLIELMKARKKKLYCTFIDFSKAFDSVWRIGLWGKLIQNGINGKCFQVIYSMYQGIKSCVSAHNTLTDYFLCCVGVRQGKNLSPLLFSLFVNSLVQICEKVHIKSDGDISCLGWQTTFLDVFICSKSI